ncbi:rngB [Symbiodinium microadriaticum]|nr:rngB [Symbiodinium microadriaticum]
MPMKGADISQSHVPFWARLHAAMPILASGIAAATSESKFDHDAIRLLQQAATAVDLLDDVEGWQCYFWHKRWQFLHGCAEVCIACQITMLLIATLSLLHGLGRAVKQKHSKTHINGACARPRNYFCVLVAFSICATGTAVPGQPPDQTWRTPSNLELWTSGQATMEEQMQQAYQHVIDTTSLERVSREAPSPNFEVEVDEDAIGEAWFEDQRPTTHISVWVAAPFYIAESLDVAMNFPLTYARFEDMIRSELRHIPEHLSKLTPTTPQLDDDFASYIACPEWAELAGKVCIVIDCLSIGGPAFAAYFEGPLTKRNVLAQVPADDISQLEVFLYGQFNPLGDEDRREALMGGVAKVLQRGQVCDWATTELTTRLREPGMWRPDTDHPHPASGYHVVYQSVDDQVISECEVPDPGGHEQRGSDALEITEDCWSLMSGEPPEHLSHGGKIVLAPIAIMSKADFIREEVTVIFLDLRQLTFFPQWMSIRGPPTLDPGAYLEDIQFPQLPGWEVVVTGGEPINADSKITVRDGEVITFHLQKLEADDSDEEMQSNGGEDEDSDSDPDSDSDSSGCSFDSSRLPGLDPPPPNDGRPRGPPPPQPLDRSRSPRRTAATESTIDDDGCKLRLADYVPARTFDLTQQTMPFPHNFQQLWAMMAPWPETWLKYSLQEIQLHPIAKQAVKEATDWCTIMSQWTEGSWDFHLFTDGSAKPERGHSGYSVVVLLRIGAALALVGLVGEQLVGNPTTTWSLLDGSALEAEQAAVAVALLWAIQMRSMIPALTCTVHFDCLSAGLGASGKWQPVGEMGAPTRHLDLLAQSLPGLSIQYQHVKGHEGNAWNELADGVAKALSLGGCIAAPPPDAAIRAFLEADLSWAGISCSAAANGSLPIEQGMFTVGEPSFRPFQLTESQLIPTIDPPGDVAIAQPSQFRLRACSVNVQGLAGHHKYVEEQLDHMGVNIAFMQETKGHESQCCSKLYYRLETEACRHFGVAIWFHRQLGAWTHNETPVTVQEEDVEVLHHGPRLLAIVVRHGEGKFGFISGHCPDGGKTEGREEFLRTFENLLLRLKHVKLLLCGVDLNGRIPTDHRSVSGSLECGEPDANGRRCVDILDAAGVWVPATFETLHRGDPHTYCRPTGIETRIDYLFVGGTATVNGACSQVRRDFDNGSPNEDHRLSLLTLEGDLGGGKGRRRLWRPTFDSDKLATTEGQSLIAEACKSFQHPDWATHPDEHCQMIQDHIIGCLQKHFAKQSAGPRASYIPDEVWRMREAKNSFKRLTSKRRALWRNLKAIAFNDWRGSTKGNLNAILHKQGLLYELAAAAIGCVTRRIKRTIASAKDGFLQRVASEGHQGVTAILQRARKAGIGGRSKRPVGRPLPKLVDPESGLQTASAEDRDKVWLHFFGEQERGEVITTKSFLKETACWTYDEVNEWSWDLLPTSLDIERVFRCTPKGKAAGLDGIPSDLLSQCAADMTQLVQPLYLKALVCGRQPIQWRGGCLYEAYKNAGPMSDTASHRSLYISSFLGKSLHKVLRGKIQNQVQSFLHPLHCGSKQGVPILFPSLFIAEHLRRCKQMRKCSAVLFVDCRAAYYRLIRELAVGDIRHDRTIEALFAKFNLDGEDIRELQELISTGGMLYEAEIPEQIRAAVRDFHLHTWAVTRFTSGERLCTSRAGSRPGASWADTIFAFIYAKILYKVHELLEGEGLNFHLPCDNSSGPFSTVLQDEPQEAWDTTWADDTAWAVEGDTAEQLLERTQRLSSIVVSLFRSHGLAPNLKRDKTSIILRLVGAGARKVRHKYFSSGKAELYLEDLQESIPVVRYYRHLGAIIDGDMKLHQERRHRIALASSAYDSAKDLLLQNRDLQIQTRASIFQSAVVATYFNLPLWIANGSEWTKMSDAFSRLVRRLLSREIEGPELFKVPTPLAHWATGVWPLAFFARRSRISALISMAKAAPPVLWAAVQNESSWKVQMCEDLRWLAEGDEPNWPQVSAAGWPHWCQVMRDSPDRLRRKARKRNQEDFEIYKSREALSVLLWTMYRMIATGNEEKSTRSHRCFMCSKDFKSKAGLGAHFYKTHGRWASYRQCVTGTFCHACGMEYWSTGRLEDHLRTSITCTNFLLKNGYAVEEISAGYGSRKRQQKEAEQFTPAPPQRHIERQENHSDHVWSRWQKEFYAEVCAVLHESHDCSEQLVFHRVQDLLRHYPLYESEIRETFELVVQEANEHQSDPEIRPWTAEQLASNIAAVSRTLDVFSEGVDHATQVTETILSRTSFMHVEAGYDWATQIANFSRDHGTPSNLLFSLEVGWEALWPPARGELLDIAVVVDPLKMLPQSLLKTWRAFLEGTCPKLKAPALALSVLLLSWVIGRSSHSWCASAGLVGLALAAFLELLACLLQWQYTVSFGLAASLHSAIVITKNADAFVQAARDGDLEVVLRLLYTNPFIGAQELRDSLWEAALNSQTEVVRSLLEFRVDPACKPSSSISRPPDPLRYPQWTPLVALAASGSVERAQVVAELLSAQTSSAELADETVAQHFVKDRAEHPACPQSDFHGRQATVPASADGFSGAALTKAFAALHPNDMESYLEDVRPEELESLESRLEALLYAIRKRRQYWLERRLESAQRKHDEACRGRQTLEEEQCCVVCSEFQKTVLFMPCRHLCTCRDCAAPLQLCPICRTSIEEKLHCIQP